MDFVSQLSESVRVESVGAWLDRLRRNWTCSASKTTPFHSTVIFIERWCALTERCTRFTSCGPAYSLETLSEYRKPWSLGGRRTMYVVRRYPTLSAEPKATDLSARPSLSRQWVRRARENLSPSAPQTLDQARRIKTPAALSLQTSVELIDQRCHRQLCAVASRFVEADAEILTHPVDSEAEIKRI